MELCRTYNDTVPFQVGDIVRIRRDLDPSKPYNPCGIATPMLAYQGMTSKVIHAGFIKNPAYKGIARQYYKLQIDLGKWNWTRNMLEVYDGTMREI